MWQSLVHHHNLWLLLPLIGLDLLLSGDNAVVIALVCHDLPPSQRRAAMGLGVGVAVALRIVLAAGALWLLTVPGLRIVGALFLLYVAVGMVREEAEEDGEARRAGTLLRAVLLVGLTDVSMSVDNVAAVAALARGDVLLIVVGVALSIPLVVLGAEVLSRIVDRVPLLVWAGAALLGWVAGGVAAEDPLLARVTWVSQHGDVVHYGLSAVGLLVVVAAGLVLRWCGRDRDLILERT